LGWVGSVTSGSEKFPPKMKKVICFPSEVKKIARSKKGSVPYLLQIINMLGLGWSGAISALD